MTTPALVTHFARSALGVFNGYVLDPADLTRRLVVEVWLDGLPFQVLRAERFDPVLKEAGYGDGCYSFTIALPSDRLNLHHRIEVRLANTGESVGAALDIRMSQPSEDATLHRRGLVKWAGGLRLTGWTLLREDNVSPVIRVFEHETLIAQVQPPLWSHDAGIAGLLEGRIAFDLHLPSTLEDGHVHTLKILDEAGLELEGSPVPLVVFPDGLRRHLEAVQGPLSEALRSDLFDRLLPMSLPLSSFEDWRTRFPAPQPVRTAPIGVILIGEEKAEESIVSLEQQANDTWTAAAIPSEQGLRFIPQDMRDALSEMEDVETILIAPAGMVFDAQALGRISEAFIKYPQALRLYPDVELGTAEGATEPLFFSAFDQERQLEQGYAGFCFALPRTELEAALTVGAATPWHIFNRAMDRRDGLVHLPGPIGVLPELDATACSACLREASEHYLNGQGISASLEEIPSATRLPAMRITRTPKTPPRISILIPTKDQPELLRRCLDSLTTTSPNLINEIIVIDNGSTDPEALSLLETIEGASTKVVKAPGPFNFAKLINQGARAARGDILCLLNNDIEILYPDWLSEMTSRLSDPDIGAVGPVLHYPNGMIQHGGIVLGPYFSASDTFNDRSIDDPGPGDLLTIAHECSAVTGACLLTRRADFEALKGFDAIAFPVAFNDVDYCLRLREKGKRIVLTPHARLLHRESASRGQDRQGPTAARFTRELTNLRQRWRDDLLNDPYFSPLLALDIHPFSSLAWPPRSFEPRINEMPKAYG